MSGISSGEIRNRIRSMESTKQITRAMKMVASSKLRRAQANVAASRPYFKILHTTMQDISRSNQDMFSPFFRNREGRRVLHLVIAGDRGLAGGYNSNVLKRVLNKIRETDATVLPIGKKAVDFFRGKNLPLLTEAYAEAAKISLGDCFSLARHLSRGFLAGEFDEIHVTFTRFVSMLSQEPASLRLLPLERTAGSGQPPRDRLYESDPETVFAAIVPEYLGGILYSALCESRASEQAARQAAMDSATRNADDLIAELSLKFNRSRQAAITREISEIVAGS